MKTKSRPRNTSESGLSKPIDENNLHAVEKAQICPEA
jgi:hypothetical protein